MKPAFAVSITLIILAGCGSTSEPEALRGDVQTTPAPTPQSDERIAEWLRSASQLETESRFAEAAIVWRQIRESLVAQHGPNHWQVANCDQALATDERLAEMDDSARTSIQQLRTLEQQAAKLTQSRAWRRALDCVNEAKPIANQIFNGEGAIPLRLQIISGQLAQELTEWETAKSDFEKARGMAEQLFASPHPELEQVRFHLGIVERNCGDLDRSIGLLQEAQQMCEQLEGRDTIFAIRTHELGVSLHRAGRFDEAVLQFEAAEQIRRAVLGERHPLVAESLVSEAVAFMDQQKWDLAQAKLEAAEPIADADPASAPLVESIRLHLATIYVVRKDFPAAELQLLEASELIDRRSGRLNSEYAHVAYRLAMCLAFQGKYESAEPLFRHALEVQGNLLGTSHERTQKTVQGLAMLLQRTERPAEAQSLRREYAYTSAEAVPAATQ